MRTLVIVGSIALLGLFAVPVSADTAATCFGREATIVGTSGFDVPLLGTNDPDVIVGLAGGDQISSFDGDDFVCGGSGADQNIDGGLGNDFLKGGPGSDELQGSLGNDRLIGGESMFGDDGDDYLRSPPVPAGSAGGWEVDGGDGTDTCVGNLHDRYTSCEIVKIIRS